VSLDVSDDLIEKNAERWTLSVEGGHASAEPGGSGDVRVDVRALAALWSGFVTTDQMKLVGAISGPDQALVQLGSAFAGGTPAMSDMF
jgi:predicted acetyltransferase